MKNINLLFSLCLMFLLVDNSSAQNTCCLFNTTAPELATGFYGTAIPLNQNTPTPVLAVAASSDLPNTEYLITKRGTPALNNLGLPDTTGGGGDVVIGADADGIFNPAAISNYGIGLAVGDTFDLVAVGFDLDILKILTQEILNGTSGGQPCCNLFIIMASVLGDPALAGFCDSMNTAGIYDSSDVNSLADVLTVFDAYTTDQISVASFVQILQVFNSNGSFISVDCGGTGANNFIPFGVNQNAIYGYEVGPTVISSNSTTCCLPTTVAPEILLGVHGVAIPINQNTPAPILVVPASSDLTNTEFLISKRGTPALDKFGQPDTTGGGGDVVLGADIDGIFMPMDPARHGISLAVGDTFDLTAFGYDLQKIKILTNDMLNNSNAGTPCCNLFVLMASLLNNPALAGYCDSVNNVGIYDSTDINNLADVLDLMEPFWGNQSSVASLTVNFQTWNNNGSFVPAACGGTGANDFLPFGVNKTQRYAYAIDNPLVVQELSAVARFVLFPNPASQRVQLHFTTQKQVDLSINLYNSLGQAVLTQQLGPVEGDFYSTLSLDKLNAGIYTIELTDGYNRATQKLMVR